MGNGHRLQTPIKVVTGGTYNVGRNEAKRTKVRALAEVAAEHNRLMRAA